MRSLVCKEFYNLYLRKYENNMVVKIKASTYSSKLSNGSTDKSTFEEANAYANCLKYDK
jgi:hypothetical protein